jgi:hypothetical protein
MVITEEVSSMRGVAVWNAEASRTRGPPASDRREDVEGVAMDEDISSSRR